MILKEKYRKYVYENLPYIYREKYLQELKEYLLEKIDKKIRFLHMEILKILLN